VNPEPFQELEPFHELEPFLELELFLELEPQHKLEPSDSRPLDNDRSGYPDDQPMSLRYCLPYGPMDYSRVGCSRNPFLSLSLALSLSLSPSLSRSLCLSVSLS
jgi:hypothetical protein